MADLIRAAILAFLGALAIVAGLLIGALIATIPLYLAWNWALVDAVPAAQLPKLTMFQAFGVLVAFRTLISSQSSSISAQVRS